MSYHDQHIALVEAVNAARTHEEHDRAEATLRGFRDGLVAHIGTGPEDMDRGAARGRILAEADNHYLDQGIERPMCGGVFLDWKPMRPTATELEAMLATESEKAREWRDEQDELIQMELDRVRC